MADPVLELDAAASNIDGTNPGTSMLLVDSSTGWGLISLDMPTPEPKLLWTSSVDMDGSLRADPGHYENRTITASLEVARDTAALCQAQLRILGTKIGKIAREGGTLKVTWPSGNTFIFDLLAGSHNIAFDHAFVMGNLAAVTVTFTALPGARGAEQDLGDNVETTLPWLIFTEASVPGDIPAFGRLVIDNDQASAQGRLIWAIQSRYYSSASTAALFYQAESCSVVFGSVVAGPAGASGSSVVRETFDFANTWSILHYLGASDVAQTHIGTFRIYARVYAPSTNTGTISLRSAIQPIIGGANIRSTPRALLQSELGTPIENKWAVVDIGLVTLPTVLQGTQGWIGTVEAVSTVASDVINVDWIAFVPVDEGSGILAGESRIDVTASTGSVQISHNAVLLEKEVGYWATPFLYVGDYLLVPPTGAEGRATRVMAKFLRAISEDENQSDFGVMLDEGIDDISARLHVTPRYLNVPSA